MNEILTYFPNINSAQQEQFKKLESVYSFWNEKINVISRKDIDSFYTHHVLHSLAIAKIKTFDEDKKILDLGTGGGFPGIPLAILFPKTEFILIDSIGKKINVVKEVIKELALSNVYAEQIRAEDLKSKYDFVVSRAVTQLPKFIEWIKGRIIEADGNGVYYLKGGDLTQELEKLKQTKIFPISNFFLEEYFLTKLVVYIPYINLK